MSILDAVLVYVVWFVVAFIGCGIAVVVLNYKDAKRQKRFREEQRVQRRLLDLHQQHQDSKYASILALRDLDVMTWGER